MYSECMEKKITRKVFSSAAQQKEMKGKVLIFNKKSCLILQLYELRANGVLKKKNWDINCFHKNMPLLQLKKKKLFEVEVKLKFISSCSIIYGSLRFTSICSLSFRLTNRVKWGEKLFLNSFRNFIWKDVKKIFTLDFIVRQNG